MEAGLLERVVLALLEVNDPRLLVVGVVGVVFIFLLRAADFRRINAMREADLKHIYGRQEMLWKAQENIDKKNKDFIALLEKQVKTLNARNEQLDQELAACHQDRIQQGRAIKAQTNNLRNLRTQMASRGQTLPLPLERCRHEPPHHAHP